MSQSIKVVLPDEFDSMKRAYFYQTLSLLDSFLLPNTSVRLQVRPSENIDDGTLYYLEISFENTIVKTSAESVEYEPAIKKMIGSLQDKFADILAMLNKKKDYKKDKAELEEEESNKTIH